MRPDGPVFEGFQYRKKMAIAEFNILKKFAAAAAGPVVPPCIERRGTIRHGCMRRIRRRMKHAAPPRHREARRLDREAPGSTGKHYCCLAAAVPTRAAGQIICPWSSNIDWTSMGPARACVAAATLP